MGVKLGPLAYKKGRGRFWKHAEGNYFLGVGVGVWLRERMRQQRWENYTLKSFNICTIQRTLLGYLGRPSYSMQYGGSWKLTKKKILSENRSVRDHMGSPRSRRAHVTKGVLHL